MSMAYCMPSILQIFTGTFYRTAVLPIPIPILFLLQGRCLMFVQEYNWRSDQPWPARSLPCVHGFQSRSWYYRAILFFDLPHDVLNPVCRPAHGLLTCITFVRHKFFICRNIITLKQIVLLFQAGHHSLEISMARHHWQYNHRLKHHRRHSCVTAIRTASYSAKTIARCACRNYWHRAFAISAIIGLH